MKGDIKNQADVIFPKKGELTAMYLRVQTPPLAFPQQQEK